MSELNVSMWLVRANCGDYYCGCTGCDEPHVIGIYSTEMKATAAGHIARAQTHSYHVGDRVSDQKHRSWAHEIRIQEVRLDELPLLHEVRFI